ncbi:MAG: ABC transporter ATP-binding protein/permease [Roseomonas sp.]|nr:ABC transporter ATP-binding protein/permease [Roseomonas sp.]MCA3327778.1 ABC transporter ATP-binding protein/permease [Roseomonas sp.]MCA3329674.1 ABC transporter ATP-binding protein/permease [Roseomonas sp.]MCA3334469.1 ABC transporter ATP-binding protein/permease [Roseomonas sp.]MCA3348262.1 ABC transporter ATP-binding protein/permease [Roseomonas sp.]
MTPPASPPRPNASIPFSALGRIAPHLWPVGEPMLRLRVVAALLLLAAAKAANVLVPIAYARAVDALAPQSGAGAVIAVPIALLVGYGLLRVMASALGELRNAVFSKVQARAGRRVALQVFRHLHALSMRFHMDRATGGLSRVIERGVRGIATSLNFLLFNIIPTIVEILFVAVILWWMFAASFALTMIGTIIAYVAFTLTFTNWRLRFRRQMNQTDEEANTKAVDSLLNYETVKYFGNEAHESRRYDESMTRYESAYVKSETTLNMLNAGQATIMAVGLTITMLLAGRSIANGSMSIGDLVMVNTYLIQLYQPLNILGFAYREIKQGLTDMEQMFALLDVPAEVRDAPDAKPLAVAAGEIRFEDVRFGYRPDREILKGVSFTVPPGRMLAIVGPTGAGKSTISRLLFRFYDVTGGRVLVDGQDVRAITQQSLRAAIGVVPQDTVLFNDTIRYNIAYGRPGATDAEIENAAKLAQVHDFVMRLPDGYATRVGERGLKLSGGEKQRVAIARTILKDPRLLILDEATSALDTRTEQDIQAALRDVARNRTTLVIAHRLSTVVEADEIIVLQDGTIAERGTHGGLIAAGGLYADMWRRQSEAMAAAEAAARAQAAADLEMPRQRPNAAPPSPGP